MIRRVFTFLLGLVSLGTVRAGETEFLFLVTGDGIRHQEVFTGVDPNLMNEAAKKQSGIATLGPLKERFWAESAKERREKLMPFFWKMLAKEGVIYGNRSLGSAVNCGNH